MTHFLITYLKDSVPTTFVFRNVRSMRTERERLHIDFGVASCTVLDLARVCAIASVDYVL